MDQPGSPRVLVVVLDWNGAEDTLACLDSLGCPAFDVLVIDNGSRVSVVPEAGRRFPRYQGLELATNLGYAGGNNVGLRRALDGGYAFAWVLSSDTIVDPAAQREAMAAGGDVACRGRRRQSALARRFVAPVDDAELDPSRGVGGARSRPVRRSERRVGARMRSAALLRGVTSARAAPSSSHASTPPGCNA